MLSALSLPAFIVEAKLSGDSFRLNSWRAPEARRQNYLEWLLTRDNHVKEVKLFGLGPLLLGRYEALYEKFYLEDRALALRRALYGFLLSGVSLAAFYGSYAFMASRAAAAALSLGAALPLPAVETNTIVPAPDFHTLIQKVQEKINHGARVEELRREVHGDFVRRGEQHGFHVAHCPTRGASPTARGRSSLAPCREIASAAVAAPSSCTPATSKARA